MRHFAKEDIQIIQVPTNNTNDDQQLEQKLLSRSAKAPLVFTAKIRVDFIYSREAKKSSDFDIMKMTANKENANNNNENEEPESSSLSTSSTNSTGGHQEMLLCVGAQQRASYLRMLNTICCRDDDDEDNSSNRMKIETNIVGVPNWEEVLPSRGSTLSISRK